MNASPAVTPEPPSWIEPLRQPAATDSLRDARRILDAAIHILHQGEALLRTLSADDYTTRVPTAFNASIGGHYRHCLDHFSSVLWGMDAETIDYDDRARGTRVETDRETALRLTRDLRDELLDLQPVLLQACTRVRCEVSYERGASPLTTSTLGRELVYAVAHAIHHFALIAVMARLLGASLPEPFGIAPSTRAHQLAGRNPA